MADLDRGFGGEDRLGHCCRASPSSPPVLVRATGPQLLHHRQRGRKHQQHLEKRHAEHHAEALRPEDERDRQPDRRSSTSSRVAEFSAILLLQRMVLGGDRLHRALHQHRVEQTQPEADAEEDADHQVAEQSGGQRRQAGRAQRRSRTGEPAGKQRTETPTARLALASSLLHLNPAVTRSCPDDSVRGPPSVSEGDRRAGITQGVAPFVGRCSVPIGDESDGPGAGNPRGFFGFYQHRTTW